MTIILVTIILVYWALLLFLFILGIVIFGIAEDQKRDYDFVLPLVGLGSLLICWAMTVGILIGHFM